MDLLIQKGDRVDFGAYGVMYVACVGDGKSLWVTKRKWQRAKSNAAGYYIEARCAKRIVEKYQEASNDR